MDEHGRENALQMDAIAIFHGQIWMKNRFTFHY